MHWRWPSAGVVLPRAWCTTPIAARNTPAWPSGDVPRRGAIGLSMGSVGDAYDKAMAESFFALLETELIDRHSSRTRAEAKLAVFDSIEAFYNPQRRHSALDYVSPAEFERRYRSEAITSAA